MVVMDRRVPEPRVVTELIIWQKKSEFGFELLIYFYYLHMQFCLPLALLHSIHLLTQLFCINKFMTRLWK